MKGNLIGPDNQKFEADIVRYFQNVNDKYLVYSKGEKDNNGFTILYVTKVISDNGIKIGENIADENEWSLIKNFLKQTVNENKENKPLSIVDVNPIEVNDLKINASKPFKLQENVVELFGKNKKSFEIVQQMIDKQNTATPVAPEVSEFVTNDASATSGDVSDSNISNESASEEAVEPKINTQIDATEEPKPTPTEETQQPIEQPTDTTPQVEPTPQVESQVEAPTTNEEVKTETTEATNNFEEMYNNELERNNELTKEMEQLIKDNAELKAKMDKLKELLN